MQLLSRTTHAALYAVYGTKYGVGDGSTTFGTPNLTARTLIGRDTADATMDVTGETGGAKTHVHTGPSHTHTTPAHTHPLSSAGFARVYPSSGNAIEVGYASGDSWTSQYSYGVTRTAVSNSRPGGAQLGGNTDASAAGATGASGATDTSSSSSMQPFMVARWVTRYADVVAPPAGAVGAVVATPNTLVLRDGAGRSQIVAPVAAADIANKGYVDGKFTDTGWLPLPLHANVVVYGAGTDPIYRVVGSTVTITGAVKPKDAAAAALLDGSTGLVIADLPVAIQPTGNDYQLYSICQGSNDDNWLLSYSGGQLKGARYRTGTPSASTWMPFSITYNI